MNKMIKNIWVRIIIFALCIAPIIFKYYNKDNDSSLKIFFNNIGSSYKKLDEKVKEEKFKKFLSGKNVIEKRTHLNEELAVIYEDYSEISETGKLISENNYYVNNTFENVIKNIINKSVDSDKKHFNNLKKYPIPKEIITHCKYDTYLVNYSGKQEIRYNILKIEIVTYAETENKSATDKEKEKLTQLNYDLIKNHNKKRILDIDNNIWEIIYINRMKNEDLLEIIRRIVYACSSNLIVTRESNHPNMKYPVPYYGYDCYIEKKELESILPNIEEYACHGWPFSGRIHDKQNKEKDLIRIRDFSETLYIGIDKNGKYYNPYRTYLIVKLRNN